jgi:hypothetical protein
MNKALIVQIDSLSLDALQYAINNGYMPFVKNLADERWNLQELFCGLPSTTPASQVQLFYGLPLLPGFRFVLKKEKKVFASQYIDTFQLIEDGPYLKNVPGLLRNGRGIMSLFSGGSPRSLSVDRMKKDKIMLLRYGFFLLNPLSVLWRILRMMALAIIERAEQKKSKNTPFLPKGFSYLAYRMFHELFIGELGLFEVKKSIPTDEKIIYVNFTGYDELSHHYGGYSNFSMYYLSIIDLFIKQCYETIKKNNNERELMIISDHGFAPCIPVTEFLGTTIGQKIASFYPGKKIIEHKLEYKSDRLKESELYLLNSGGFCQGYYVKSELQVTRKDLEKEYPDFCKKASNISAVEFVLIKEKEPVVVKGGRTYDFSLGNASILFPLIEEKYHEALIKSLYDLMNGPYAPDVCIVAKILEKNKVVDFEPQLSAHGAFGGFQTQSFLLSQKPIFKKNSFPHMRDLHDYLENKINMPATATFESSQTHTGH